MTSEVSRDACQFKEGAVICDSLRGGASRVIDGGFTNERRAKRNKRRARKIPNYFSVT